MLRKLSLSAVTVAALAVLVSAGCNNSPSELPPAAPETKVTGSAPPAGEEHAHKPGSHGGLIVPIGQDNYHAEAIFEKGGGLRLYMLGREEERVQEAEAQTLTAHVKLEGEDTEPAPILLKPAPQEGDTPGKTSQFVAKLPGDLRGRALTITIPSITIAGERFRLLIPPAAGAGHDGEMPAKVSADEERDLYLTPGGLYSAADIEANGRTTASEKFKGLKSAHNAHARAGDKVCPISETKANPRFVWVVGGRKYEFCCPPCVDEFVKTSKEHPEKIKDPAAYVQK